MNLSSKRFLLCLIAMLCVGCGTQGQIDRSNKMTNQESEATQAAAIVQLFEDADKALSEYQQTRSLEASDRFDKILVQIENRFPKLAETYSKNMDSNKERTLGIATRSVHSTLAAFRKLKGRADQGIKNEIRAPHMITTSNGLVENMRTQLTGIFRGPS